MNIHMSKFRGILCIFVALITMTSSVADAGVRDFFNWCLGRNRSEPAQRESGKPHLPPIIDSTLDKLLADALPDADPLSTFEKAGYNAHLIISGYLSGYVIVGDESPNGPEHFIKKNKVAVGHLLAKLVSLHESGDAKAARYFEYLGRKRAEYEGASNLIDRKDKVFPPPPKDIQGEYWEMGAGASSLGSFASFDPKTHYVLFEKSPFIKGYLDVAIEGKHVNAEAVCIDVRNIQRPSGPIAALRAKNMVSYAPGFEKKLFEMADWIAPGGQIILQSDYRLGHPETFQKMLIEPYGSLIKDLAARGWRFEYYLSTKYGHPTIILTRPLQGAAVADQNFETRWREMEERVRNGEPTDSLR
jgi:hypothetical protein